MIYILIPCYNDSRNFPLLLDKISVTLGSNKYKIIIVDDGSTDATKKEINRLSLKYPVLRIGYRENHGPGFAFDYGFKYLLTMLNRTDLIVTMEADNSTDFTILRRMITKCRDFDIVLSSPFSKNGQLLGLDINRYILSIIANFLDLLIFRIKNVRTYSSFYRVYSGRIIINGYKIYDGRLITENGFSAVVELLIKLSKIGGSIHEIASILDWQQRKGKSKMKIWKTIIRRCMIYKNYIFGKYNL